MQAISLLFSHCALLIYGRVMCCGTVFYLFEVGEAPKIFSLRNCPCCKATRGCVRQSVMVAGLLLNVFVCVRTVSKCAFVCARRPACWRDRRSFLLCELCRPV